MYCDALDHHYLAMGIDVRLQIVSVYGKVTFLVFNLLRSETKRLIVQVAKMVSCTLNVRGDSLLLDDIVY